MDTLDYIVKKYNLDINARSPIEIPNIGRNNLPELFKELRFKVGAEIGGPKPESAETNAVLLCESEVDMSKDFKNVL